MKKYSLILLIMIITQLSFAQKYITKSGHIEFFSSTPVEDIFAETNTVNSALDISNGAFVFKVLMKSFEFEKALMQEHFNENYIESDKFPNAKFSGKIENIKDIDFTKDGEYNVDVKGKLTIHGITNNITESGIISIKDGVIYANSVMKISPKDYEIDIPKAVIKKIADNLKITVNVELKEFKKK